MVEPARDLRGSEEGRASARAREGGPGLELVDTPDPEELEPLTPGELRAVHQEHFRDAISDSQAACGQEAVPHGDPTFYRDPETEQLWLWGVRRCRNATACPVCVGRVARERGQELRRALERHLSHGGGAVMVSATIRHHAGHGLQASYDLVADAWRRLKSSAVWKDLAERIGYVGSVQANDTTHGPNGWHPHKHAVILTREPLDQEKVEELERRLGERWADRIERCYAYDPEDGPRYRRIDRELPAGHDPLFGRPTREHGLRVQMADAGAAEYVAEMGLAREVTRVDCKKGRKGHRTPKQILQDFARWGRERDANLWREYNRVMRHKPAVVWSRGLRDRLELLPWIQMRKRIEDRRALVRSRSLPLPPQVRLFPLDLEELLAAADNTPEDELVLRLSSGTWKRLQAVSGVDPGAEILRRLREGSRLVELRDWIMATIEDEDLVAVELDPGRREIFCRVRDVTGSHTYRC